MSVLVHAKLELHQAYQSGCLWNEDKMGGIIARVSLTQVGNEGCRLSIWDRQSTEQPHLDT